MKIVIAPNAFKGSLSAADAAEAMAMGAGRACPEAEIVLVPVADGGDGLVDVAVRAMGGERRRVTVSGPRRQPVEAEICHVASERVVAVEMALASGLALLSETERDPTLTTTFGTGELIRAALDLGATRIVVGIGGSATNDGGIGMAEALGIRFLDAAGTALPGIGASLAAVADIDMSGLDPRIRAATIEVVCDVDNPLCGPNGAACIYGPQKGATPEQAASLDQGLTNLAGVINERLGVDVIDMPGAGAAGGLGAGLHAFLGASLRKGIDVIIGLVGLREKLDHADLVLTGEGRIDEQTAFGKAPAGVAAEARKRGIPCLAVAGAVGDSLDALYETGITAVFSLCPAPLTLNEAMAHAGRYLEMAAEQAVRAFAARRGG